MSSSSSYAPSDGSAWNFGAGPGALPPSVLAQAAEQLQHYAGPLPNGSGLSVMCMSHRSPAFESIMRTALSDCRSLLQVPDDFEVLFMHGGGTGGFASVPLNLTQSSSDRVAYAVTGTWSKLAAAEASKYAQVDILVDGADSSGHYAALPPPSTWKSSHPDAKYLHVCWNETQHGLALDWSALPPASDTPLLVADMSSCFMSGPITHWERFACIYAGAHKNVGPVGVTIYIVRRSLLAAGGQSLCPSVLNWQLYAKSASLYNTPSTWAVWVTGMVFRWIEQEGGVEEMQRRAKAKAKVLYDAIEQSGGFYRAFVADLASRSLTNICFTVARADATADTPARAAQDASLNASFVQQSEAAGFVGLAGHRVVGALRASVYNGLPQEGVEALVRFMRDFQSQHQQKAQ